MLLFLQSYTFTVVTLLAVLTVIGQIIALVLIALLVRSLVTRSLTTFDQWLARNALVLMLVVAVTAVSGSLFFSEIAQWTPCRDCWFQRIFMYPQVILLTIALWKKDPKVAMYVLVLCLIGMIISIDHYSEQVEAALHPVPKEAGVNVLFKPCDASGISCASTEIAFTFGYITIPMMALTAFILNTLGSIALLRRR